MEVTYAICDSVEEILNVEISKYHYYERKNIPISEVIKEIVAIMDAADSRMFDHILSGKEKDPFSSGKRAKGYVFCNRVQIRRKSIKNDEKSSKGKMLRFLAMMVYYK